MSFSVLGSAEHAALFDKTFFLKTPCGINMSETVFSFKNFFLPNIKIDISAIRKAI